MRVGVTITEAVHAGPLTAGTIGSLLPAEVGATLPSALRLRLVEPPPPVPATSRSGSSPGPPVLRTLTLSEGPDDGSKRRIRYVVSVVS